jgi:conjugative relaxase-like TrwC/TraI family protein
MLKITKIKCSGAAKRYFETLAENDDYYVKPGKEEPGDWDEELNGNRLLGLEGRVERKVFGRVFDGYAPDGSKEKLVQSAGRKPDPETGEGGHRAGWDFTFSAVKSFSIMSALSDDLTLKADFRRAHDEARRETLAEIERHTMTRVRAEGKVVKVPAQMVAASFFHEAARGQDGQVPDMQIHSHVIVFNVTARVVGTKPDGTPLVKTTALEPRNLYEMEVRFGRMYRDKLEAKVQALGFETYKVKGETAIQDMWEISGVPKPLIREFSKRSEKIRKEAQDDSAQERDRVALRTRDKKQPKVHTKEACQAHWKEVAEQHGFFVRNVPRWRQEKDSPFEHISLPERERFVVKADAEREKTRRDRLPEREAALYPEPVVGLREESQTRALVTDRGSKARSEEPSVDKASERALRVARSEWRCKGYKVICCTWSAKKAKAIEAATKIDTQTIQKIVNQLQGIRYKRVIEKTYRKWERAPEEKGKSVKRTLREVYAEYKHSTWQWSGKTKKKYLGEYYKATSQAKHEWWYATHRISQQQKKRLDAELQRQKFQVTRKTVVLVDAKQTPSSPKLQKLVSEVEKLGGRVVFTQDPTRQQVQAKQHTQRRTPASQREQQSPR